MALRTNEVPTFGFRKPFRANRRSRDVAELVRRHVNHGTGILALVMAHQLADDRRYAAAGAPRTGRALLLRSLRLSKSSQPN